MKTLLILLALLSTSTAEVIVIRDAKVHTVSDRGTLSSADVLIRDGRIQSVGTNLAIPAGAEVVEGRGLVLTPGLFAGLSGLGLEEVTGEAATVDDALALHAPAYEAQWRPEFDVTVAFNPRSVSIPVTRVEGITWTVLAPGSPAGGSILAGQGRAVTLSGDFDATLPSSEVLFVHLGSGTVSLSGGSRAGQFMLLEQAVRETRVPTQSLSGHGLLLPAGREAFARYLAGGRVVFFADRAADIRQAIRFARRHGMSPIIAGGAEAWVIAPELAMHQVPVLLDTLQNLPADFDQVGARLDNAALLQRAGVPIVFSQSGNPTQQARKVRQLAGNAVAHGLPFDAALSALTATPARVFGQSDRGSIAPGQIADLVLWNGDPLELTTTAVQVWIAGARVPMSSRQTELRDRYSRPPSRPVEAR